MRVLLSAYACEPGAGSERGKGWDFAVELGRQGHEVTVLTCGSHHRAAIERLLEAEGPPRGLDFVWHDVPRRPGPGYDDARGIRMHYMLWQMTARRRVARLVAERGFDVIHHLTWTVLRWPSFLGGLGPRFVFGPVGGGQSTPWSLRQGFPRRGWENELKRDALNLWSRVDPLVWLCLGRADAVLVTDEATRRHVPGRFRHKTFLVTDVYAPPLVDVALRGASGAAPTILFAGRLEYWKGAQLALGTMARLLRRYPGLSLSIAGSGPEEGYLRALAVQLGIADAVRFLGSVPREAMSSLYSTQDMLLFPSLHDSGPHVIGEALAHGLPVICLDLGGPAIAVEDSCGRVVATAGRSRAEVEDSLATAVARYLEDPGLLARTRKGAQARALALSYRSHVAEIVERFYRVAPAVGQAEPGLTQPAGQVPDRADLDSLAQA